jgi:hypothetical protein
VKRLYAAIGIPALVVVVTLGVLYVANRDDGARASGAGDAEVVRAGSVSMIRARVARHPEDVGGQGFSGTPRLVPGGCIGVRTRDGKYLAILWPSDAKLTSGADGSFSVKSGGQTFRPGKPFVSGIEGHLTKKVRSLSLAKGSKVSAECGDLKYARLLISG